MIREKTHELQALEKWLQEMLVEDIYDPIALTDAARESRLDLEKRAKLAAIALEPLIDHIELHSEKLARLVKQVFRSQERVVRDAISSYRKQKSAAETLTNNMDGLIGFSERQLKRQKQRAHTASRRAAEYKDDLESNKVSMKILQVEHKHLRKKTSELETVIKDIEERTDEDLEWSTNNDPNEMLGGLVDQLELERRRKLKSLDQMDALLDMFESDHLSAIANQRLVANTASAEHETQTLSDELEANDVLLHLIRVKGKAVQGIVDSDPPLIKPKKWRTGWHIPFSLRSYMSNFQANKRVMVRTAFLKIILQIFQFKLNGGDEKDSNAPELSSPSRARTPTSKSASSSAGTSQMYLSDATYQVMSNIYGLSKLADWHIAELINSCNHFKDHRRALLFSFLLRVSPSLEDVIGTPSSTSPLESLRNKEEQNVGRGKGKGQMAKLISVEGLFPEVTMGELPCETFIFDFLGRLNQSNNLNLAAALSTTTDEVLVNKQVVLQSANQILEEWKVADSGSLIRDLSQIPERTETRISRRKQKPATSPKSTTVEQDEKSASFGDTLEIKIDLDDILFFMAGHWVAHEKEWEKRIVDVYARNCKIMRYVSGIVIECTTFEVDSKRPYDIVQDISKSKALGYFAILDQEGFRSCLKDFHVSANKRQASTYFEYASQLQDRLLQKRSETHWLKVNSTRPEDKSRTFYVNQLTNERVWDSRPQFDNEIDEIMRPAAHEELGLEAFILTAFHYRWDGTTGVRTN